MVEVGGFDLGDPLGFVGSGLASIITWVLATIALIVILGILAYLIYQRKVYNRVVNDFENVSGQGYVLLGRHRARLVKTGDGGEELLYLRKLKQYRTAYGRKMGNNVYWFAKGQDGYFYNIVLGDLDAKMGMLDIEPIDRDMRYMHVAIRKNIKDRYNRVSFMDKYGTYIMSFFFLMVMVIAIWFLLDQIGDVASSLEGSIRAADAVNTNSANIVSSLDNICTGGSGLRPVPAV